MFKEEEKSILNLSARDRKGYSHYLLRCHYVLQRTSGLWIGLLWVYRTFTGNSKFSRKKKEIGMLNFNSQVVVHDTQHCYYTWNDPCAKGTFYTNIFKFFVAMKKNCYLNFIPWLLCFRQSHLFSFSENGDKHQSVKNKISIWIWCLNLEAKEILNTLSVVKYYDE